MEFWFSEFHTPDVKHSIRDLVRVREYFNLDSIAGMLQAIPIPGIHPPVKLRISKRR